MGASSSSHENSHGTYSTSDAELYDAACDDDLGKIKKLLADGAQPDRYRHQSRGETAFAVACRRGHVACAQELANAGCDTLLSEEARAVWDGHRLGPVPKSSSGQPLGPLGMPPAYQAPVANQARAQMVKDFMRERYADEGVATQQLEATGWDLARAIASYLPPVPDSPVAGRTLATSRFKAAYAVAEVPEGPLQLGGILTGLTQAYCKREGIDWRANGNPFFKQLQQEAMANGKELSSAIPEAAQRLWTSAHTLQERELCFMINNAVRGDYADLVDHVAQLSRAINQLCVTAGPAREVAVHPPDNICYRGGGFDDRYRSFYVQGRQFRQPAYLATSFSVDVADNFIKRSKMPAKIRWLIRIDPDRKCLHVNLVKRTNVPGEEEYLFAPYSAFTVSSATWNAGTVADPHVVELLAAVDNKEEPEDLPLAPWS